MRRLLALALAGLGTGLFGCGDPETPAGLGEPEPEAETRTLAVIPKSTGGEFWETVERGALAAAEELGIEIRWEGTLTETEIAEQNKIIENMINLEVDGIVLAPLNQKAMRKSVEAAVAAGIPVVVFDSAVEGQAHLSFVATDNTEGGSLGGRHMVELLGDEGGRVIVLRYIQGAGSTEARAQGFIGTLDQAGLRVLAHPYPEDGTVAGAKKTASNTLEGYVEEDRLLLDGIFACNLYSTLGMLEALEDLRQGGVEVDLRFIGFDSSPRLVRAVQEGAIDALVVQNPKRMGYLAVQTMCRHLRGESVPKVIDTGVELVTAERLESDAKIRELVGLKVE